MQNVKTVANSHGQKVNVMVSFLVVPFEAELELVLLSLALFALSKSGANGARHAISMNDIANSSFSARFEAVIELYPLASRNENEGKAFSPWRRQQLILGPFRSRDRASSIGSKKRK